MRRVRWTTSPSPSPTSGALTEWCEHLTAIGIPHEGIKQNIAGHSVDLFDPDGNNIELVSER